MAEIIKPEEEQIFEKVRNIICVITSHRDFPVEKEEVTMGSRLKEDLDLRTVDRKCLKENIQHHPDFDVHFDDMEDISTVRDCVEHIIKYS